MIAHWTPERVGRLRKLASRPDKPTGKMIAEIMGGSRSSIIAACKRHGIPLGNAKGPRGPRAPKAPWQVVRPKKARPSSQSLRIATPPKLAPKLMPKRPQRSPAEAAPMISLLELRDGHCRYPHGDEAPFLFCGVPQEDGSSYCQEHSRICVKHSQKAT